jgi:hypothetical protein
LLDVFFFNLHAYSPSANSRSIRVIDSARRRGDVRKLAGSVTSLHASG